MASTFTAALFAPVAPTRVLTAKRHTNALVKPAPAGVRRAALHPVQAFTDPKAPGSPPEVTKDLPKAKKGAKWEEVLQRLQNRKPGEVFVAATAPTVRISFGETAGLPPADYTPHLVAFLRHLGFDYVFDVLTAADLTIMEEGTELIGRVHDHLKGNPVALPMFTSCCPGWINEVETKQHDIVPHLSTCKSPQGMMGAIIKNVWAPRMDVDPNLVTFVSCMPCVRKQGEAERDALTTAGKADVDVVLTTEDLGVLLDITGTDINDLKIEGEAFDDPLGDSTGSALVFGTTGGVMEAALRTAYYVISKQDMPRNAYTQPRGLEGVKEAKMTIPISPDGALGMFADTHKEFPLSVAIANGLGNAKKVVTAVLDGEADYNFVEIMACPGGCVGGGGQPKIKGDRDRVAKRQAVLYDVADSYSKACSHENEDVVRLYDEAFDYPNSHKAHELLHTHYTVVEKKAPKKPPPKKDA